MKNEPDTVAIFKGILKREGEERGLKQPLSLNQASQEIGMSRQALHQYMSGERKLSIAALQKLARAMNWSVTVKLELESPYDNQ